MPSQTVTVSSSKIIHAGLSSTLAVLHDPPSLARLNPLVIAVDQSPKDPSTYLITDRMRIFGFSVGIQWVYSAKFTFLENGADVVVEAAHGVRLINQWRAQAIGAGVEVTENVIVDANGLIRPLVIYMLKNSHKELLNALAKQLEGDCNRTTRWQQKMGRKWMTLIAYWIISMAIMVMVTQLGVVQSVGYGLFWLAGIVIGAILIVFGFININDPYGSFHLGLNIPPGADSSVRPDTEWLNMGHWKDTHDFPRACEALALKVIENAHCVPGGHVLDVGHACGDSLLLHLCHPELPRPATLTGITSIPLQHARSRARIEKYQLSAPGQPCEVQLFCGDAISRSQSEDHPLSPLSSCPQFTSIIAIDCAYHFVSRDTFLRQSLARLAPGGTISLGDLAVSKPLPAILRTVLSKLLGVHSENMVTANAYEKQLKMVGYANVRIEDISHDVFPGFQTFLQSKGGLWRIMGFIVSSWEAAGGRFLIVSATKPNTQGE